MGDSREKMNGGRLAVFISSHGKVCNPRAEVSE